MARNCNSVKRVLSAVVGVWSAVILVESRVYVDAATSRSVDMVAACEAAPGVNGAVEGGKSF